jgi:hypothetical protein
VNPFGYQKLALGIGKEIGTYQGIEREWLYWYDQQGQAVFNPGRKDQIAQALNLSMETVREIVSTHQNEE